MHEDAVEEMSLFDRVAGVGRTRQDAEDKQFLAEFKVRVLRCGSFLR
jgi:hypothetical protein